MIREIGGTGCLKSKGSGNLLETGATGNCARFTVSGKAFRSVDEPGQCLDYFSSRGWGLWSCNGGSNQQLQREGSRWCTDSAQCVEEYSTASTSTTAIIVTTVTTTGFGGSHCKPLTVQADKDRAVNIVMVPSAFKGDMATWTEKAKLIQEHFKEYVPLDADNIPGLNVWYVDVDVPDDEGEYCWQPCHGIRRLLCCRTSTFKSHARKHCGSGFVMETLVIHNSLTYGGAGYRGANVATATIHSASAKVAVHEHGHSLFGFGDEYNGGAGPQNSPNCDYAGCPRWKDLIGRFDGVSCQANRCGGNRYYASGSTLMRYLGRPFGAALERMTCCKYLYHTQVAPPYCQKFNQDGLNLAQFCNTEVWDGKFTESQLSSLSGESESSFELSVKDMEDDPQGARYSYVEKPVAWEIVRQTDGTWVCQETGEKLQAGLYSRQAVAGDTDMHFGTTNSSTHQRIDIEIRQADRMDRKLLFFSEHAVGSPAEDEHEADAEALELRISIEVIIHSGEHCHVV